MLIGVIGGVAVLVLGIILILPAVLLIIEGDWLGLVLFFSAIIAAVFGGILIYTSQNTIIEYCACFGQALTQ